MKVEENLNYEKSPDEKMSLIEINKCLKHRDHLLGELSAVEYMERARTKSRARTTSRARTINIQGQNKINKTFTVNQIKI